MSTISGAGPHQPLILVSACRRMIGTAVFDVVRFRNVEAVVHAVRGLPLVLPTIGRELDIPSLLSRVDGVYLTGSESNIDPRRYGEEIAFPQDRLDQDRDETTLRLIRAAVDAEIPLLAICRGFQELNVAFGGSLHQAVHDLPEFMDHREDESQPRDIQYSPAHELRLDPSGALHRIFNRSNIRVNSLHQQGIKSLGSRLRVEGTAPDGLVEAVSVKDTRAFAIGVQWHPEWFALADPISKALFEAFGDACRQYAAGKAGTPAIV